MSASLHDRARGLHGFVVAPRKSLRDSPRPVPPVHLSVSGQTSVSRETQPRISPEVGTPVPAVTSTCSTSGTWLTEVPRSCRTPSAMPFMPWMYASPSWPPWVLIGSRPPISMAPSAMKSLASP